MENKETIKTYLIEAGLYDKVEMIGYDIDNQGLSSLNLYWKGNILDNYDFPKVLGCPGPPTYKGYNLYYHDLKEMGVDVIDKITFCTYYWDEMGGEEYYPYKYKYPLFKKGDKVFHLDKSYVNWYNENGSKADRKRRYDFVESFKIKEIELLSDADDYRNGWEYICADNDYEDKMVAQVDLARTKEEAKKLAIDRLTRKIKPIHNAIEYIKQL